MPEETTIEQLTPEAVQAAMHALHGLPMEKLKEILAAKKKEAKIQAALEIPVPPFPEYVKPEGKEDVLNYEYGLELAYRPSAGSPPKKFLGPDLVNCMHVKPYMPLAKKKDRYEYSRFIGDECALQHMFKDMLPAVAKHIGAKVGGSQLSSCSDAEIEFVSPIIDRLSQMEWYYRLIRGIAEHMECKVETKEVNSGGGHIHVTPKGETKLATWPHTSNTKAQWTLAQKTAMVLEVCNKPWLPWIFNDPDDHSTARSPIFVVIKAIWAAASADNISGDWRNGLDRQLNNMAVRFNEQKKPTLEFRMFGAPLNSAEQKLHILFLDKWIKSAVKKPNLDARTKAVPKLKYVMPHDLRDITYDYAVGQFKEQLAEFGLDYASYEPFVERNMKVRYAKDWIRN